MSPRPLPVSPHPQPMPPSVCVPPPEFCENLSPDCREAVIMGQILPCIKVRDVWGDTTGLGRHHRDTLGRRGGRRGGHGDGDIVG